MICFYTRRLTIGIQKVDQFYKRYTKQSGKFKSREQKQISNKINIFQLFSSKNICFLLLAQSIYANLFKIPIILQMKTSYSTQAKTFALLGLLLVALYMGVDYATTQVQQPPAQNQATTEVTANPIIIPQVVFQFDVFCPIDSEARLAKINEALDFNRSAINVDLSRNKNFYVVITKAQPSNISSSDSDGGLYYCGLARKWWELDCQNAQIICSIPGPMFYFQKKEKATIMIINDIYAETVHWIPQNCYSPDSSDTFCSVSQKEPTDRCTYFQPTDFLLKNLLVHRVRNSSIPISLHIHGLQTRPTFDGNPLAWYNTAGQKGPGFNSLLNQKYYSLFNNPMRFKGLVSIDPEIAKRSKVIQVPNDQNPGFLIYHDHAMKSTTYNVKNGLLGIYIIADKNVQAKLPKGAYQKIVVFAKEGDARIFVSQSGVKDDGSSLTSGLYRIRMLNAHFDDIFYNVSFSTYYETVVQPDGTTTYKELDPTTSPDFNLTAYQHRIPFTVIGTDTSLFNNPIYGVDQVDMGSAERVDILIDFAANLPDSIKYIYIICFDNNEGNYVVKYRFTLPWTARNNKATPVERVLKEQNSNIVVTQEQDPDMSDPQYTKKLRLRVPFVDLSTVPDRHIAVKRHRPLFSLPRDMNFMIGAHYMFEKGASQNPQIGTIEDFYIVNNLWQAHPIHFHLVNFQLVKSYRLKQLRENSECTLYLLDFFRLSGLPQFQKPNVELCTYIWNLPDEQVMKVFDSFNDYMRQDMIDPDRNSGLNTLTPYDNNTDYSVEGCALNTVYKYICEDTTPYIQPYRRRWKDTSLVPPFTVQVFRMRWASNTYDPKIRSYPYFSIPEDQLIEFPGYVYHCHILPHEDNEMMRPVMLRHSDIYLYEQSRWKPKSNSCSKATWLASMKCINERMGCPA